MDLVAVAQQTPDWTGADLKGLCREAALFALRRDVDAPVVCAADFDAALCTVQPSLAPSELAYYASLKPGAAGVC